MAEEFNTTQHDRYGLELRVLGWVGSSGTHLVTLIHGGGAMRFQFDMTPMQAIELAGKLVLAADTVKQVEVAA